MTDIFRISMPVLGITVGNCECQILEQFEIFVCFGRFKVLRLVILGLSIEDLRNEGSDVIITRITVLLQFTTTFE